MHNLSALPILYSLRNCPYAMRARLAIAASGQKVRLREVVLSQKPAQMLRASPKGTVPVLVLENKQVLEQSLEIMQWSFEQSDSSNYLLRCNAKALSVANTEQHKSNAINNSQQTDMHSLVALFDTEFKTCLEQYRSAKRYHDTQLVLHRNSCQVYLQMLEDRLSCNLYLCANTASVADLAIMPFIRQMARVERQWYLQSPYPKVRSWLDGFLQSPMFSKVMAQYPLWLEGNDDNVFGGV